MDFSPATIRNEMADLTSMGLLEQPHTSAGRVPSAAGYRLYVDELMQSYRLSMDETKTINQAMEVKMQEVDKMISQVGKLVSKMTDLPAYAVAARSSERTVKRFDLILAEAGSFILVVMLSDNQVQNKLIRLPLDVSQEDLRLLSAVLNASLTELTADEITPELLAKVTRSAAGAAKLLGQPEYHDVEKAQEVLTSLDEDVISNLPATLSSGTTQILVGPENVAKELKDSSVVITKFDIGDGMQGMIGVVGPTRMDYAKITARLSYFAENLGRMFAKPQQPALHEPALTEEPKK